MQIKIMMLSSILFLVLQSCKVKEIPLLNEELASYGVIPVKAIENIMVYDSSSHGKQTLHDLNLPGDAVAYITKAQELPSKDVHIISRTNAKDTTLFLPCCYIAHEYYNVEFEFPMTICVDIPIVPPGLIYESKMYRIKSTANDQVNYSKKLCFKRIVTMSGRMECTKCGNHPVNCEGWVTINGIEFLVYQSNCPTPGCNAFPPHADHIGPAPIPCGNCPHDPICPSY